MLHPSSLAEVLRIDCRCRLASPTLRIDALQAFGSCLYAVSQQEGVFLFSAKLAYEGVLTRECGVHCAVVEQPAPQNRTDKDKDDGAEGVVEAADIWYGLFNGAVRVKAEVYTEEEGKAPTVVRPTPTARPSKQEGCGGCIIA